MNLYSDMISAAVKLLLSLGFVVGGLLLMVYLYKKFTNQTLTGNKSQLLKILSTKYLGNKKSISLVEVPGTVLVIGVTNEKINVLEKIKLSEISVEAD